MNNMKKIIGILCIALFAGAMFFSNNTIKEESNTDLASLLTVGVANAETANFCRFTGFSFDVCRSGSQTVVYCVNGGSGCIGL
jgi:hypothetical protein